MVAKSKKTLEDKEYELQEIAQDLYVYNTLAFVGKNASGKTTAIELLECCYSILGEFRLENKHYKYDNIKLEMIFYHDGKIYCYKTILKSDDTLGNKATFTEEEILYTIYYKTNVKNIYNLDQYEKYEIVGNLPEDTSNIFFVLKKKSTAALYFDSEGLGADTYSMLFKALKNYVIPADVLPTIIRIFDENIKSLHMIDDHNYKVKFDNVEKMVSDKELIYLMSSGTTKGIFLYILAVASLKNGFDLLIDEIENHFHKTLVENLISLYKDKSVNRNNASLIFTTHYCEVLDLFNRRDNICIAKANDKVYLTNMYEDYGVRTELLKSKQFYNNTFQTAVNYEDLMDLKRKLMV